MSQNKTRPTIRRSIPKASFLTKHKLSLQLDVYQKKNSLKSHKFPHKIQYYMYPYLNNYADQSPIVTVRNFINLIKYSKEKQTLQNTNRYWNKCIATYALNNINIFNFLRRIRLIDFVHACILKRNLQFISASSSVHFCLRERPSYVGDILIQNFCLRSRQPLHIKVI